MPLVSLNVMAGVTVNVAEAESPTEPVALIVCPPNAAEIVTVNDPVIVPVPVNVQVFVAGLTMSGSGVLERHVKGPPTSPESNPLPLTVTTVPANPEVGLSVIIGPVTVKVAEAKSPELPVA